jgi:META domain
MEFAGTTWTLVSFDTDVGAIPALIEAPTTLNFSLDGEQEGTLSGRSGCNRYFASYSLFNEHLHIGPIGCTRRLCSPAQMTQETRFLQAPGAVYRARVSYLLHIKEAHSVSRKRRIVILDFARDLHTQNLRRKPCQVTREQGSQANVGSTR